MKAEAIIDGRDFCRPGGIGKIAAAEDLILFLIKTRSGNS